MDNPSYLLDGNPIEDPESLEEQLTDEELELIQTLQPGEAALVGGGASATWIIERIQ